MPMQYGIGNTIMLDPLSVYLDMPLLLTCLINKDYESYYFFVQELIKDKYREQYDKEMDPNPSLKFLK